MVVPGTLLEGKYEILDKIREGGMGSIYRVRHRLLEEIRVVKVMKPSVVADEDLRRRFVEEARTATRLKHPNICTIHDFAIDDSGMAYLVMEFIEGINVSDLLKIHGRPALPLTLEIAHQSLLALGFLHRKGIVHRDVAPDNIMLAHDDQGNPVVKLIDLGIAKVAESPIEATATGVFLGKLKYASPEQYGSLPKGHRLDGRSDLYGMGIVLYELLTGVLPYEGDTVVELLRAHVFSPPKPFSQTDPEGRVPTELRGAILKALQKKREDRFENAEEFDREMLTIRRRYARSEDLEETRAVLRRIRPSREVRIESATPSAQDHMDRHFAAASTPSPSVRIGEDDRTAAAPVSAPALGATTPVGAMPRQFATTADTTTEPLPRQRSRRLRIAVALAVAAVVVAAVTLFLSRSTSNVPAPEAAPAPAAVPTAAEVSAVAEPSPPSPAEPTPEEPTPAPAPTEPPRAPSPRPTALRTARLAPPVPDRRPGAPTPADAVAVPVPPAAISSVAALPPTAAPPPEPSRPTPLPTVRAAPSEADRIRETVRLYETAQNTLNPDLYVRAFPGVDRARIEEAFQSFRSQSVQFEVRRIEIDPRGTSAEVYGFETRVAVPKAGNDLRVNADRVLTMQKRGDSWVITAVR